MEYNLLIVFTMLKVEGGREGIEKSTKKETQFSTCCCQLLLKRSMIWGWCSADLSESLNACFSSWNKAQSPCNLLKWKWHSSSPIVRPFLTDLLNCSVNCNYPNYICSRLWNIKYQLLCKSPVRNPTPSPQMTLCTVESCQIDPLLNFRASVPCHCTPTP